MIIPLTQGKFAVIGWKDRALRHYTWYAKKNGGRYWYAARTHLSQTGRGKTVYLHREILIGCSRVDHINRDTLDCRRGNLRPATVRQNSANQARRPEGKTSQFKGVYWHKARGMWAAHIQNYGVKKYLGLFKSEEAAARVYDRAAKKAFCRFAKLNK